MGKKAFIIYSGNNQRAIVSFSRVATEYEIPFFIIAFGGTDPILQSEYGEKVFYKRRDRELRIDELIDCCNSIRLKNKIDQFYVLPSTEYLNRFLLNNIELLKTKGIFVPLVNASLYSQISDKNSFSELCEEYKLKVPEKIPKPTINDIPFVIKPREYFNSDDEVQIKPIIVENRSEFERIFRRTDLSECFFQEYISGESYYLLIYKSRFGKDICFSQKNIAQQAEGGSIIAAETSDIHTYEIATHYLNMLESIGFHGLIMIELRYNKGEYYMIEANPRLWGPSQLFVDAGIPIFERFISELDFEIQVNKKSDKTARYFWHGGLLQDKNKGNKLSFHSKDEGAFFKELNDWILIDIYNRKDTKEIYKLEIAEGQIDER